MCNHNTQIKEIKDGVLTYTCQGCGTVLHAILQKYICCKCGHEGELGKDIIEGEEYRSGRDARDYFCEDLNACLDRCIDSGKLPHYYRKTDELNKVAA